MSSLVDLKVLLDPEFAVAKIALEGQLVAMSRLKNIKVSFLSNSFDSENF